MFVEIWGDKCLRFIHRKTRTEKRISGRGIVDMENNKTMDLEGYLGVKIWATNLASREATGF
jgi:hypothetical protein